MIGLIQRVKQATVTVDQQRIAMIDHGLLVFLGIEKNDTTAQAETLLKRIVHYRIFADQANKMNRSLLNVQGGLLIVPQFTLAAQTNKGLRPSFTTAATPQQGKILFEYCLEQTRQYPVYMQAGIFGADMQVQLVNDGPVTFWLQT